MSTDTARPFGAAPQRTPVEFDASTGGLRIGPYERRVDNPTEPGQVYSAYLSLLYAVRGARPGERLALREADLEALLLIVGDDPETIEERLVGLMGCTAEEASILGRLLLRHRKATATLGVAAGLTLGAAGVVSWVADEPATPAEVVQSSSAGQVEEPTPISGVVDPAPSVMGPVVPAPAPVVGPVATAVVQPPTTSVVVAAAPAPAAPAPVAPAPARAVVAAPPPVVVAEPASPPLAAPAPVEVEVVEAEPAYALPTYAEPVLDAPPPTEEVEEPDFDIGEPAIIEGPLEEIGGVVDSNDDLIEEPVDAPVDLEPISGTAGG